MCVCLLLLLLLLLLLIVVVLFAVQPLRLSCSTTSDLAMAGLWLDPSTHDRTHNWHSFAAC